MVETLATVILSILLGFLMFVGFWVIHYENQQAKKKSSQKNSAK